MKTDYTDITLLVDRSGSMYTCRDDMEGAIQNYIKEIRESLSNYDVRVSYFCFDSESVDCLVDEKPLKEVDTSKFVIDPRGCTPLLDAIGRVINKTGMRLASKEESDRPHQVLFVIITDGYENASVEHTYANIMSMITHQTEKYNWGFVYLGANQDAFIVAANLGIDLGAALNYSTSEEGSSNTSEALKRYTVCYTSEGSSEFSEEDRVKAMAE